MLSRVRNHFQGAKFARMDPNWTLPPFGSMAQPASQQSAEDAEDDRHDATAGVAAGHQKLRDRPRNSADDDPADDPVVFHRCLPFCLCFVQLRFSCEALTRAGNTGAAVNRKPLAFARLRMRVLRKVSY